MSRAATTARPAMVHPVDQVPAPGKLVTYGFQHVAAFYAGAVIVPIIIGGVLGLSGETMVRLIQADLLTCGIASIIQAAGIKIGRFQIGVRLPLLQGVAFAGVAPIIAIGFSAGGGDGALPVIFGAVIAGGVIFFLVSHYIDKLLRFFPPVVTGSVLTIIGVTLVPVAANHAIGGQLGLPGFDWSYAVAGASQGGHGEPTSGVNLAFAAGTLVLILVLQRFFKGFMSTVAVLIALVVGSVVWFLVHPDTDWAAVGDADWFWFATPFHFGAPVFQVGAIISILVVMMITAIETVGSLYATGDIVGKRIKRDDVTSALRADGLSTTLGGTMGSFPYTCFAENIGLVRVTGVKSRWIVVVAGGFMILLGLFPKAAAVVEMIPEPVLGGAALALFAAVAVVGIQTLSSVDFNDHRNLAVAGTAVAMGIYVATFPAVKDAVPGWLEWFFSGGISAGAFTALILNVVFFHTGRKRSPVVALDGEGHRVRLDTINDMDAETFAHTFSEVVQGSPWILERARSQQPFAGTQDLHDAFQDTLLAATLEEQLALLTSFPDLAAEDESGQPATKEHRTGLLGNLDEEDHADLTELTDAYRDRFGFPLIVSAHEHERFERLIRSGWSRMDNSPTLERQAALVEVAKIFHHRFDEVVADANPIMAARFGRFSELNHP